jgi:cytochrome c oxidase assembly protein Cox11
MYVLCIIGKQSGLEFCIFWQWGVKVVAGSNECDIYIRIPVQQEPAKFEGKKSPSIEWKVTTPKKSVLSAEFGCGESNPVLFAAENHDNHSVPRNAAVHRAPHPNRFFITYIRCMRWQNLPVRQNASRIKSISLSPTVRVRGVEPRSAA